VEVARPRYQPLTHVAVMDWWALYPAIGPKIRQQRDFLGQAQAHQALELDEFQIAAMSVFGTKRTCPARHIMSVLGGKADIKDAVSDFR